MSPEMQVIDIPQSARLSGSQKEYRVLSVTPMPSQHIADIYPNPVARYALPNSLRYLASSEYLQQHAYMVTGEYRQGSYNILTPIGWGRAVPVVSGCIPYADRLVGSIVSGKGSSASGFIYPDSLRERDSTQESTTPWGFFGHNDASFDIEASNYLLSIDYRTALGLGYVIFKDSAIEWLCSHYDNPVQKKYLTQMWEVVRQNNDSCAYLFRLHGVCSRIGESVPGSRQQAGWAAKVHLAEAKFHPQVWQNYFLEPVEASKAIHALKKISHRKNLTYGETKSYIMFMCGLLVRNQESLLTIDTMKRHEYSAMMLSEYKDIDMAHIRCDYEEMRGRTFLFDELHTYLHFMYRRFQNSQTFFKAIGAAEWSVAALNNVIRERINLLVSTWKIPVTLLEE